MPRLAEAVSEDADWNADSHEHNHGHDLLHIEGVNVGEAGEHAQGDQEGEEDELQPIHSAEYPLHPSRTLRSPLCR